MASVIESWSSTARAFLNRDRSRSPARVLGHPVGQARGIGCRVVVHVASIVARRLGSRQGRRSGRARGRRPSGGSRARTRAVRSPAGLSSPARRARTSTPRPPRSQRSPARGVGSWSSGEASVAGSIFAGSLGLVAVGALLLLASGGPLLLLYWASVALSLLLLHGLWIMTVVCCPGLHRQCRAWVMASRWARRCRARCSRQPATGDIRPPDSS